MTDSGPEPFDQGAGREVGSLPMGVRSRARRLYRARRQRLLQEPVAALQRRFGEGAVEVDELSQYARVTTPEMTLEMGFAGTYRMFGATIDTQWVGMRGAVTHEADRLEYRFDKKRFVVKKGSDQALATRLADDRTQRLADRSELKKIVVASCPEGRRVVVTPLPGTITAVYFPPMPPYTVPLKPQEATDHIDLVLHLLSR
jgi:hypothetical protein